MEEDLQVTRLSIANSDPRFYFRKPKNRTQLIIKGRGKVSDLGELLFAPEIDDCSTTNFNYEKNNDCYVGIPLDSKGIIILYF